MFHKAGKIVMYRHRPHWEQAKGMLVPLDMHDGKYYMKGHGKVTKEQRIRP